MALNESAFTAGEQVGELSHLRGGPRASDVIASTDVRVLAITKEVVETLLAERPDVAKAMLASVAERLAAVTARAEPADGR